MPSGAAAPAQGWTQGTWPCSSSAMILAAGLKLGYDLVGDFVVKARPAGTGTHASGASGHRGSPRRAPRASLANPNPSRPTRVPLTLHCVAELHPAEAICRCAATECCRAMRSEPKRRARTAYSLSAGVRRQRTFVICPANRPDRAYNGRSISRQQGRVMPRNGRGCPRPEVIYPTGLFVFPRIGPGRRRYAMPSIAVATFNFASMRQSSEEIHIVVGDLLIFVDDTGHETFGSQRYFGLGGCAVLAEHYPRLKSLWMDVRTRIKGHPDARLHASDKLIRTDADFKVLTDFFADRSFFAIRRHEYGKHDPARQNASCHTGNRGYTRRYSYYGKFTSL